MLEIYKTNYRIYLAWALQYRVVLGLWALAGVVELFVALAVWRAVAAASGGGSVGGFDQAQFATYFVLVMIIADLTHTWIFWVWDWRVREGLFSALLLRPTHPLHADVIDNLAVKTVSMAVKLPIAVVFAHVYDVRLASDALTLAVLGVSLVLAYGLRVAIESCIACLAFWVTKLNAIVQAYYLAWAFLSGQFAPVSLLPGIAGDLAHWLPFRWALAFPVEVAMGRLDREQMLQGLGMQLLWFVTAYTVFRLMWRAASTRYTAVGS